MNPPPPDDDDYEFSDDDGDENYEDAQGAAFWDSPTSAVPLEGSDKYLIVSGPNAGKISDTLRLNLFQTQPAPRLPGRDDALDNTMPIFLAHRGGQHRKLLPHTLARLHYTYGRDVALGAIIKITGHAPEANRDFFDKCATAAVRIADPVCYLLDVNVLRLPKKPVSSRASDLAPYLGAVDSDEWVPSVLNAQRQSGANLLLTPGRALDTGSPEKALTTLFDEAEQAVSILQAEERLCLNLTLPGRWLVADDLREKLFNELLDHEEYGIWYVRAQWPAQRSYMQPTNENLLQGYKRLAELATDENRTLLLPQSGLTGWLMLAFGARGFGVGSSATDQALVEPSFGRSKGATRKGRYFEKQLLHTVENSVHDALSSEPDYQDCTCPYCPALLEGQIWSHELAGLHGVFSTGCLTANVHSDSNRGGYRAAIRRAVRDAIKFGNGKDLADTNTPQHLGIWDRLL